MAEAENVKETEAETLQDSENQKDIGWKGKSKVQHVHEIVKFLFLGDFVSATDASWLEKNQIKRVISILSNSPDYCVDKYAHLDINHKYYEADDISKQMIAQHFTESIDFIQDAINNGENILIHCRQGVSRSCTIVCAYLMSINPEWSPAETVSFVRKIRPIVEPNEGFMYQLKAFKLNGHVYNESYTQIFDTIKQTSLQEYEELIQEIDSTLIDGYDPSTEILDKFENLCFDLWAHPYESPRLLELKGDIISKYPKWSKFGLRVNDYVYIYSLSGYDDIIGN